MKLNTYLNNIKKDAKEQGNDTVVKVIDDLKKQLPTFEHDVTISEIKKFCDKQYKTVGNCTKCPIWKNNYFEYLCSIQDWDEKEIRKVIDAR